jgi:RNA-binding protein YhbY
VCPIPSHARETFFPGHRLELVLADVSELILGQVHKQQNRRQFPIKVELVFSELLAEKLIARALVRQADFAQVDCSHE